jgi:hypothetical protein
VVPVSGAVMLRFECIVQPEDLVKIARALHAVATPIIVAPAKDQTPT